MVGCFGNYVVVWENFGSSATDTLKWRRCATLVVKSGQASEWCPTALSSLLKRLVASKPFPLFAQDGRKPNMIIVLCLRLIPPTVGNCRNVWYISYSPRSMATLADTWDCGRATPFETDPERRHAPVANPVVRGNIATPPPVLNSLH